MMIQNLENKAVEPEKPAAVRKPLQRLPCPPHRPERWWKRLSPQEQHDYYRLRGIPIPEVK